MDGLRGSLGPLTLDLTQISMSLEKVEIQAHEPKKITIKKKAGESFGMKLGTRVFVQGLTKDGLADKEGVSQNASVDVRRRSYM